VGFELIRRVWDLSYASFFVGSTTRPVPLRRC
jgi:hypothetical protein